MTKKWVITGTAIAGLMAYVTGPTRAQDDGQGGLHLSLGVQQSFSAGDNLALGIPGSATNPEEGTTTLSTTNFALQLESATRIQQFSFLLGGGLRYGSLPSGRSTETGFVDPQASIAYTREGYSSRFTFSLDYNESDISQPRPLWDFSDDDEVIDPPSDLSGLRGSGQRQAYNSYLALTTGIGAPIGFRLTANASGVRYENETVATLDEFDRAQIGADTFFHFTPTTAAVLGLRFRRFDDNTATPARLSRGVDVGLDHEFANQSDLSVRVGYTNADTTNVNQNGSAKGATGSVTYNKVMPNGTAFGNMSFRRTENGEISTILGGRGYQLANGRFRFSLGASSVYGNSAKPIGGLGWQYQMPVSRIAVNISRRVIADGDDEDRFTSTVAATYVQQLTAESNLFANLSYYLVDRTTNSTKVERTNLELGYQYELTEDWNLDTGFSYRIRDEETVGQAESSAIFVSLSRRFDLF
ncbi:hypothetical protein CVM52_15345 [Pseudooceanicola lipolyticus]|uniref:Porin domain-containing protein n=2 Tax=Pseudooceanicola lipolyticus TaxID=2029104 RepID=A0A2M8IZ29_9RHOB|nr:hypothetical protein CVM52_15345 [Pseudooceanicola lipolyticus]